MMRKLIRDEGLLCGGSSGAAVSIALKAAKSLSKDQRCVVILPDSVRNYMTKALNDDWMLDHGFVDGDVIKAKQYTTWWATKRVCDLPLNTPLTITDDVTCKDAITLLKEEGYDMVPVLKDGCVIGVVTEGNMTNRLLSGRAQPDDSVSTAGVIYKTFHKFSIQDPLSKVAHALDHDPYALIVTEQRCYSQKSGGGTGGAEVPPEAKRRKLSTDLTDDNTSVATDESTTKNSLVTANSSSNNKKTGGSSSSRVATRSVVSGIVTRIDLLDFVSKGEH